MLFLVFLVLIILTAIVSLSLKGFEYYLMPVELRPFNAEYSTMKPSGSYSHGLGIFGALMIIVGVSVYSTRKRIRALWSIGKLSRWLEFHIVLCLLGPILVIYHTTFKAGGIAAISLWTMLSVALSGIIGRFLYTLIPRNLNGNELSVDEIDKKMEEISTALQTSEVGKQVIQLLDESFEEIQKPRNFSETISTLFKLQRVKSGSQKQTRGLIAGSNVSHDQAKMIISSANARATLLQKSIVLQQVERIFYYWHVIHLPFSIIMFITLAAHVAVALWLGYRWIL
ncbi:MAG: hypothetical protein EPO24_05380 [Bacteroidetes bacterium]|nr:MAG: hypothetical protein EPO24_05380 [Bacteroidota bacterium]